MEEPASDDNEKITTTTAGFLDVTDATDVNDVEEETTTAIPESSDIIWLVQEQFTNLETENEVGNDDKDQTAGGENIGPSKSSKPGGRKGLFYATRFFNNGKFLRVVEYFPMEKVQSESITSESLRSHVQPRLFYVD